MNTSKDIYAKVIYPYNRKNYESKSKRDGRNY